MRILVTGSRTWTDAYVIGRAFHDFIDEAGILPPIDGLEDVTLVHGACPKGADKIADDLGREYGKKYGLKIERHPAEWDRYRAGAGPIRNRKMVELGANVCLAFIKDGSKGASHCADLAEDAGIPVRRFTA